MRYVDGISNGLVPTHGVGEVALLGEDEETLGIAWSEQRRTKP